jgi:hypothetical protein
MRPLPPDVDAILCGYDAALPPADRQHILRRAIKEAQARIAKRVSLHVHPLHQQLRPRGVA